MDVTLGLAKKVSDTLFLRSLNKLNLDIRLQKAEPGQISTVMGAAFTDGRGATQPAFGVLEGLMKDGFFPGRYEDRFFDLCVERAERNTAYASQVFDSVEYCLTQRRVRGPQAQKAAVRFISDFAGTTGRTQRAFNLLNTIADGDNWSDAVKEQAIFSIGYLGRDFSQHAEDALDKLAALVRKMPDDSAGLQTTGVSSILTVMRPMNVSAQAAEHKNKIFVKGVETLDSLIRAKAVGPDMQDLIVKRFFEDRYCHDIPGATDKLIAWLHDGQLASKPSATIICNLPIESWTPLLVEGVLEGEAKLMALSRLTADYLLGKRLPELAQIYSDSKLTGAEMAIALSAVHPFNNQSVQALRSLFVIYPLLAQKDDLGVQTALGDFANRHIRRIADPDFTESVLRSKSGAEYASLCTLFAQADACEALLPRPQGAMSFTEMFADTAQRTGYDVYFARFSPPAQPPQGSEPAPTGQ